MMRRSLLSLSFVLSALLCFFFSLISTSVLAQQIDNQPASFNDAELAQILAPIALYPDSLLTHILIASTYPIEVVEAKRWADKHKDLIEDYSSTNLASRLEQQDWDASIKALVPFPRVLTRLNDDLSWTRKLGDAFLQDESRLLETIQTLRKQAERAGSLEDMENMAISYDNSSIVIEPAQQEVIYVPYYDPRVVYGTWYWRGYPPVYWHIPSWSYYYYASPYRHFYWHTGVHISVNYHFSAFNWHNRHVVISHHNSHYYRRPRQIVSGGYAKQWQHQPAHRRNVAYRNQLTASRYKTHKVSASIGGHKSVKRSHVMANNNGMKDHSYNRVKNSLKTTKEGKYVSGMHQGISKKGRVANQPLAVNKKYASNKKTPAKKITHPSATRTQHKKHQGKRKGHSTQSHLARSHQKSSNRVHKGYKKTKNHP
jgi:hypothetical protein